MEENMVLIVVDECGDEWTGEGWHLSDLLDEDEIEIWKERKIRAARERYPEARCIYIEDRRGWSRRIARDLHEWF